MLIHDWRAVDWNGYLRGGRPVSERAVRTLGVVVPPPLLDDDFGFSHRMEYLLVEEFIPEAGVEALAVPVLPRTAGLDVSGLRADCSDPVARCLGYELRPVVGSYDARYAAHDEQIRQHVADVDGVELSPRSDGQTFPAVLVDDVEGPKRPAIICPTVDEVVAPDVVSMLGPQADA